MGELIKQSDATVGRFVNNRQVSENVNAGTVEIEVNRAIAEAQTKLMIAQKFPRDEIAAFNQLVRACKSKDFAEQASYTYERGGQTVSGPSIRLAEEAMRCWGNMEAGIRELSQKDGFSEMEAYCWDYQTNCIDKKQFVVYHERHTRQGKRQLTDPRDIYELTANMGARRKRACMLALIPPDLIEASLEECRETIAGKNGEPIPQDKIDGMVKSFARFGVTREMVEKRLGQPLKKITRDEYFDLLGIFNSIKDANSKPGDWFDIPQAHTTEEAKDLTAQVLATKTADPAKGPDYNVYDASYQEAEEAAAAAKDQLEMKG